MNRFFRQVWRIRRMIIIWLLLLAIASVHWLKEYAGLETVDDYNRFAKVAIGEVFWGFILSTAILGLYLVFKRWNNSRRLLLPSTFETKPWLYDRSFVTLTGQVVRILPKDFDDSLQRRSRNILRLLTRDPETVGRDQHLRFFLSAPAFPRGEQVLVLHNLEVENVTLHVGDWVQLKGEYIHQRAKRKGFFGAYLSAYGRIHYTHPPKGYLEVLDGPPGNPKAVPKLGR